MQRSFSRRRFLALAGTGLASAALAPAARPGSAIARVAAPRRRACKKAVKLGMVQGSMALQEKFALLKRLGFDGVELESPNDFARDEVLRARDATGLPIHGVVDSVHWKQPLSDPEPTVREAGLEGLRTALRDAQAYGASTVLLVPAVVTKQVSYAAAWDRSRAMIAEALPLAGEVGVKVALENVWNNFLLSPLETARYIDEFDDPNIGAYFDVGNCVRFAWPEHWVEALGQRILKVDVKEYSRKKQLEEGLWKGFSVELLEGDCDWPAVMRAFDAIGFEGWFTAEIPGGDAERLRAIAERMDRIFAS